MVTLPAHHSRKELDLARRLAEVLGVEDLHVFWSERTGPARPSLRDAVASTLRRLLDR